MKQTARIISTYTGDTSGVCSALFELGGLTVMHDPSGCNSTYSTHDEPRWYDYDSLIFISGLTEKDAIFGNDEKIISDTVEAAKQLKPRFIAIAGSPIPYMTGCDFDAIAMEIENRTGIPSFGFDTNGMHSYIKGAGMAFSAYAYRMCRKSSNSGEVSINILGVTPLDFSVNGSDRSLKNVFEERGIKVNSVWSMGSSFEEIENSGNAAMNVVVSSCGLESARVLEKKFGTPYICGAPFGSYMTNVLAERIKNKTNSTQADLACAIDSNTFIIGEPITSLSLSRALMQFKGIGSRVISPMDTPIKNGQYGVLSLQNEDEIAEALKNAECVIADPMYKPICNKNIKFVELPHEAFSGRIYRTSIPNLIEGFEEFTDKNF